MKTYRGSCHCGAVQFQINTEFTDFTSCNCSLCRRRNAVMTMVPKADLEVLQGEDQLTLYEWNTKIAKHYFCKTCGIYTFHQRRSAPDHYGVNVYCLDDKEAVDAIPIVKGDGASMSLVEERA